MTCVHYVAGHALPCLARPGLRPLSGTPIMGSGLRSWGSTGNTGFHSMRRKVALCRATGGAILDAMSTHVLPFRLMKIHAVAPWLALCCLLGVPAAHAQKMHRCGNVYQDRPCDGGQAGTVVGNVSSAIPAAPRPAVDGACSRLGADAQKIMWARESGRTVDMQLGEATNDRDRRLIEDVYAKRGSAREVREAIETGCMAQQDNTRQAVALRAAADKIQYGSAAAPAARPGAALPIPPDAVADTVPASARKDGDKQQKCRQLSARIESLRRQLDALRGQQRVVRQTPAMDQLDRDLTAAERARHEERC